MKWRLCILAGAVLLSVAGLFASHFRESYFAILTAAQSAVSGFLAIRNFNEEPRWTVRDHALVKAFRTIIAKDSALAILLLQLAVMTQAASILLPKESKTGDKAPVAEQTYAKAGAIG